MKFSRRSFLKSLGALSFAMAPPVTRGPLQQLYPKLIPAEEIIPGMPYWYASTCRECPAGCGVMHKVRDGNVIKIEGNPNHPISRGGLCPRGQAALQELYNIDRIRQPIFIAENGKQTELTWEAALREIRSRLITGRTSIMTGHVNGAQKKFMETWLRTLPGQNSLVEYEPLNRRADVQVNKIVFNKEVSSTYHLDKARYILSIGADFMETWQSPVQHSHNFAIARQLKDGQACKFVYLGISGSLTSTNADESHIIAPRSEPAILLALAKYILEKRSDNDIRMRDTWAESLAPYSLETASQLSGVALDILKKIASDLSQSDASLVLCGDAVASHERGTESVVAATILNYIAGNFGKTIELFNSPDNDTTWAVSDFDRFVESMEARQISTLMIHQTNPIYNYPGTQKLESALRKVPLKIAFATTMNETVAKADFILPIHHSIETWGLDEPEPGVFSLVQPAIDPIYESRAIEEILLSIRLSTDLPETFEKFINDEWAAVFRKVEPSETFGPNWQTMLEQGGMWSDERTMDSVPSISRNLFDFLSSLKHPVIPAAPMFQVKASHRFYDGRGANKSWLWELPHGTDNSVWDTPVRIHPEIAAAHHLKDGDVVSLSANQRTIEAPVLITNNIHPNVIAMEIGAGHTNYGEMAVKETGNPISLLSRTNDFSSGDLVFMTDEISIKRTEKSRKIARVQGSYDQHRREIIQEIPLAEAVKLEANHAHRPIHEHTEIYPEHKHPIYDWAMVVDLSACNGCGSCVVSCYAENNVPIVGKQQVERGREMAWIRIERFEMGDGRSRFLPMMCQHCEHAPCETVCPVYATMHSSEGLNVQVYNRCVGTRYCSNNCPYKARRFNYWSPKWPEPTDRQLNPDIYHRPKGVMEKCTFCSHRIRKAKEDAKIEGRLVRDGEVMPACAQSCPTGALTFGNLNDPESKVSKLVNDYRAYVVFEELNTKPSVIYLKGIKHG
ncbi:4Fe-4S dicluster domain-containing protein [candidate division KSB1 bacterium]|nr:4Fe-4S dicluster domain-containing protein [candidate division KSB1 bacterium]